ncbi:hypothetical protein DYB25_011033, partial [Aphanomyces astaci]
MEASVCIAICAMTQKGHHRVPGNAKAISDVAPENDMATIEYFLVRPKATAVESIWHNTLDTVSCIATDFGASLMLKHDVVLRRNHDLDMIEFKSVTFIVALFQCPAIMLPQMSMKEASVYLDVCLERKSDVVFRDWERFLIRFGPFDKCVLKAVQCFQDKLGIAPWFHGVISRAQAEAVTTSSDDGAFLVRFSETQPDKFTLTYMKVHTDPIYNGRKEIKNVLIVHNPREGYGLQDGGNGVKYPSIASFIEGSSVRLRTP